MGKESASMEVKFSVLQRSFALHQDEYEKAALRALRSGWYVLGKELESFERAFSSYIGMEYGVGVNSGQDSLILAVRALGIGPGDEVIVQANAYIASVLGITENGATPIFVESDPYFGVDVEAVERAITPRTKAILPVHLYGQPCDLESLRGIADRHGLYLIEDCAQCHGSTQNGRKAGTFGDVSCFSFYPTKPLGAFGDAGMVLTNDAELAEKLKMLRFYGSRKKYVNEITGINSRMDEIQAAMLSVGLQYLEEGNKVRQAIAGRYLSELHHKDIVLPQTRPGCTHVYHIFAVRTARRDELISYLAEKGVQAQIHYPIPPHLSPCYETLGYKKGDFPLTEQYADEELSIPIYAGMPEAEVDYVIKAINAFPEEKL